MQSQVSVEYVTPQAAQDWLQYNTKNRPYKQHHVDFLCREMMYKRFQETAEIHLFDVGTTRYMLNGQHTCMAIAKYGSPVKVTVRKSIGTDEERKIVYSVGHDKGVTRTFTDSVNVYDIADSMTVQNWYIDKIASAIRFAHRNFGSIKNNRGAYRMSDIDLMDIVPLWDGEMAGLLAAISPCEKMIRSLVIRADVLSVALLTMHFQPDKAAIFWNGAANGANLSRGDAQLKLHKYLPTIRQVVGVPVEKPDLVARRCIAAWNRFFDDKPLISWPEKDKLLADRPVLINGTQYTGKQPIDMWPNKTPLAKAA